MSNAKQETIADIVAAMMNESHAGDASCLEWVGSKIRGYANRIEAAEKREREAGAELRKCLKAAVGEKCSMCAYIDKEMSAFHGEPVCVNNGCKYKRWREALEMTKGCAE